MSKHVVYKLILNLLDDEHGISEDNYDALQEFAAAHFPDVDVVELWAATNAVDGRRFIEEGDADELRQAAGD